MLMEDAEEDKALNMLYCRFEISPARGVGWLVTPYSVNNMLEV